ncbi:hypothetical protein WN48_00927 [Eufriesea mexicana]|uniref:Uncharacterized protein n=1 Tax=Eufriesea mexicana TaxID=516756 RepID=A0A310SD18_9HYME|nr:hypothetical protein WN48_00927 [Eufriesea mexicana]
MLLSITFMKSGIRGLSNPLQKRKKNFACSSGATSWSHLPDTSDLSGNDIGMRKVAMI